ncbi:MAG: PEP/pyruvate-binding domain-containing protein [Egibacteraceae bacterium]
MTSNGGAQVRWLGDSNSRDPAIVGGKVANLSRLAADFTVPPGFCVSAADEPAVASAYRELGERCGQPDPRVAVRSSAVDEDGPTASFAGQHQTLLNVEGPQAVLDGVRECIASFFSDQVREYRRRHGLPDAPARSSVLVQQLVLSDVSAVLFSLNPITGDRDEIVINTSWGLGESIVGGTVTPDTFIVARSDLSIRAEIAEKRRMTVAVPGGSREVDVPRRMRNLPSSDDGQIEQMARLGLDLERRMGWPVDLELAWAGGVLHLLQCRPVTALNFNRKASDS